jgi:hypothetical protein
LVAGDAARKADEDEGDAKVSSIIIPTALQMVLTSASKRKNSKKSWPMRLMASAGRNVLSYLSITEELTMKEIGAVLLSMSPESPSYTKAMVDSG